MTEVVDPIWSEDISILFRTDRLLEFFISEDQSTSEKLNSIARFGIYISIVLTLYHKNAKYLTLSLLTFIITYLIYENLGDRENLDVVAKNNMETKEYTKPTINNPFGNSSVMDIIDDPKRPPMVKYGDYNEKSLNVKENIQEAFNYNLYKDLGDLYGKANSQRQFYTTPSRGTIPADPDGKFKNWLYGSMPSCKDNTYECLKTIHETPTRKRPVLPNPLVNPVNVEARKAIDGKNNV